MIDKPTIQTIKNEQAKLNTVIRRKENDIKHAPEGSVLVKRYKKGVQFFFRNDPKDINGTYISVKDRKRAIALVQKRYDIKLVKSLKGQKKAIDAFLKKYDPDAIKKIYQKESPLRQQFVNPLEFPDDIYINEWVNYAFEAKEFREDVPLHITQRGERVRSKSEVLIANALYQAKIPYRYECPLQLKSQLIHPDFTILRMRDRREVLWEHLGMMDDTEYRNNAVQRIRNYEKNGYFPGDNLILTMESFRMPLNMNVLENMIRHYIL